MLDVEKVFELTMHRKRPLCLVAKHTYLLVGCWIWMLDVEEVFELTMHRTRPLRLVAKYMHLLFACWMCVPPCEHILSDNFLLAGILR
ncbi:unnamed protein product [Musa hybrid cultivar]